MLIKESNDTLNRIISCSKLKVLTNQHVLTRREFTRIQNSLVDIFVEIDIRIIGNKVVLNIPNNLKMLLSKGF
jgi:hypothetical protein